MKNNIRVNMLGGLTVSVGNEVLLENTSKINKPWQIFCYLVLNRGLPVPPSKLISALWAEETLADAHNVLKNTVYALRREFRNLPDESANPILFEDGGYLCNPALVFDVDVDRLEALYSQIKKRKRADEYKLLSQAVSLYRGDLLPQLAEDVWLLPREVYYKKIYTECFNRLCEALFEEKRYTELLAVSLAANRNDLLEESFYLPLFRALFSLGMYKVIVPLYQKTARLFTEELGAALNPEIRRIYAAASEKINPIEQDIMIIKDDLREITYETSGPLNAPLYCTYDVFKYLFQMVARSAERSGNLILIILVSIQEIDGGIPLAEDLAIAMADIKKELLGGLLRKSDTVARYSKSQYILMLSSEHTSGADVVIERVKARSEQILQPRGLRAVFATAHLDPQND